MSRESRSHFVITPSTTLIMMSKTATKARRLNEENNGDNRSSKRMMLHHQNPMPSFEAIGNSHFVPQEHHRRRLSFSVHDGDDQLHNLSTSALIDIICSSNYDDVDIDVSDDDPPPTTGISAGSTISLLPSLAPSTPVAGGKFLPQDEVITEMILRREVLLPVMQQYCDYVPLEPQSDLANVFASYHRGATILLTPSPALARVGVVVVEAAIEHVNHTDASCIEKWWEQDKAMSYATKEWNAAWSRSCIQVKDGCEMVKLVVLRDHFSAMRGRGAMLVLPKGTILGVAYFACRTCIKDANHHPRGGMIPTMLTVIQGIRVAPQFNPEAIQRLNLRSNRAPSCHDTCIHGIASALLCHVLFTSIRCRNNGVSIVAVKNECAERFYQNYLGLPIGMDDDGKRRFSASEQQVCFVLRSAFARHVKMWMKSLPTPPPAPAPAPAHQHGSRVLRELVPQQQPSSSQHHASQDERGKRFHSSQMFAGVVETKTSNDATNEFASQRKYQVNSCPKSSQPPPQTRQTPIAPPAAVFFWEGGKKTIKEDNDDDNDDEEGAKKNGLDKSDASTLVANGHKDDPRGSKNV